MCGAPAPIVPPLGYAPPTMPALPSTLKPFLSGVWLVALILFFVLLASNFATLYAVTPQIVDGIQDVRSGATANAAFDTTSSWTFQPMSANAAGSWSPDGGHPGGFLRTDLQGAPGQTQRGYWAQAFTASGSSPYVAVLRFDFRVLQASAGRVQILAFVDRGFDPPVPNTEVFEIPVDRGATAWTSAAERDPATGSLTPRIDVTPAVRDPGTYVLKILVEAEYRAGEAGTTSIGLDNLQLRWGTNAALVLFLIVPYPVVIAQTREATPFTAYYALIAIALVASVVFQLVVDARPLWRVMRSRADDIGGRLRARVGVVALAQTFMALYSFQVMVILILLSLGVPVTSPIDTAVFPRWFLVFELANASVWEEVISRVMMIGIPLAAASLVVRARQILGPSGVRAPRGGRYLLGSLRHLYGGTITRDSPLPTLIGAGVLLAISSAVFGLAHGSGWGDWKVAPAALAGLGLGYLYLRHGLAAAILFHFATDFFFAIDFANPNAGVWVLFLELLFWAVVVLGAGFLGYYIWYSARLVSDVVRRGRGLRAFPAAVGPAAASPWTAPSVPRTLDVPRSGVPPWTSQPPPSIPPNYAPPGRPPPYGFAPVQFRCSRCGWIEARYDQGRFTCVRCGHTA